MVDERLRTWRNWNRVWKYIENVGSLHTCVK